MFPDILSPHVTRVLVTEACDQDVEATGSRYPDLPGSDGSASPRV